MTQKEVRAWLRVLEQGPVVAPQPRNRKISNRKSAAPEKNVPGHRVGQEVPVPGEVAGVAVAGPESIIGLGIRLKPGLHQAN